MTEEEKNGIWSEVSPELIEAFLSIKNEKELKAFFRDLMSERDLRELNMRWEMLRNSTLVFHLYRFKKKQGSLQSLSPRSISGLRKVAAAIR